MLSVIYKFKVFYPLQRGFCTVKQKVNDQYTKCAIKGMKRSGRDENNAKEGKD